MMALTLREIALREIALQLKEPFHISSGVVSHRRIMLVELTDMRDAQRSYEANVNVIGATRRMIQRTLDILRG